MNLSTLFSIKNKIGILIACLLFCACKRPAPAVKDEAIVVQSVAQGVKGKVLFKEGEFAISGEILDNGKVYGVEREIYFYELTNLKDVEIGDGDFVKNTSTELIDSTTSDKHGNFTKELPIGKYSVFVKESRRLYSKLDDDDYFLPIKIERDSCRNIIIEVDYKASYLTGR